MELDSRIIEGKRPLTCFDTEQTKQFLGKECYFSDHLCTFNELLDAYSYVTADMLVSKEKRLYFGELLTVSDSDGSCYEAGINGEAEWFQFCLPCEWVKESEKKYRPFSLNEFLNQYHLGDEIIVRRKLNKDRSIHKLFTEYGGNDDTVHLGTYWFTFKDLYDNYEIFKDGEWKPFGIEVEE